MSELVDKIVFEMSLDKREPQKDSLIKLSKLCDKFDFRNLDIDTQKLKEIESEARLYNSNFEFETAYPSFVFALATGVGKTRLMGATICYLAEKQGFKDFLIVVKGETLYNKLLDDLDKSNKTPKYMFYGLQDMLPYRVITKENFVTAYSESFFENSINIYLFNIEQFASGSEDARKFYEFDEEIGTSLFKLLNRKKLAIMLDESHRYRAEISFRSIAKFSPKICLEFTATPITGGSKPKKFKNILHEFKLKQALQKGYVKIPKVLGLKNDELALMEDQLEETRISIGIQRHEIKKAMLREFSENNKLPIITPFILISAKGIPHADGLKSKLELNYPQFKDKIIVNHSDTPEAEIQEFLKLEDPDNENPPEIVIHVNKLKEGWDVKNLYTLIPLRETASDLLAEQTLGRGLRLPFNNQRTGNKEIDTFEIISHEKYSEIVAEAQRIYGPNLGDYVEGFGGVEIEQGLNPPEPRKDVIFTPNNKEKYYVKIPEVKFVGTKIKEDYRKTFKLEKRFDELLEQQIEIVGTRIGADEESEEIVQKRIAEIDNNEPALFLFKKMLQYIPDIDTSDTEDLRFAKKIAEEYIKQISKSSSDVKLLLRNHFKKIIVDIKNQINNEKTRQTKPIYSISKETITFRPYRRNVPESMKEISKNDQIDGIYTDRIITGYEKTIFNKCIFDSNAEKIFADVIDSDKNIKKWVKPPLQQSPIEYESATLIKEYNPDFFVETDELNYVVEIKEKQKLDNKDTVVIKKARAAIEWCKTINATKPKVSWVYKIIPHDEVNEGNNFKQIISTAYNLGIE